MNIEKVIAQAPNAVTAADTLARAYFKAEDEAQWADIRGNVAERARAWAFQAEILKALREMDGDIWTSVYAGERIEDPENEQASLYEEAEMDLCGIRHRPYGRKRQDPVWWYKPIRDWLWWDEDE